MSRTISLSPGTVIGVPAVWNGVWVEHVGILTDHFIGRERTVISNSKRRGQAVEEVLDEFLDGRNGRVVGFIGPLSPEGVVARARADLGRAWTVTDNCEHFVRRAHGLAPASPQLRTMLERLGLVLGGAAGVSLLIRAARQR